LSAGTWDETAAQHVRNALAILEAAKITYPKIDEALGKPWRIAYEPAEIAAVVERLETAVKLLENTSTIR